MTVLDRPLQEPPTRADNPWLPAKDPYKIGPDSDGGIAPLPGQIGKVVQAQ
jgi:hypothetical protein